jgi:hypothetical protein
MATKPKKTRATMTVNQYIRRPSQVTKSVPNSRLKARRRMIALHQVPPGVFPNPVPRKSLKPVVNLYLPYVVFIGAGKYEDAAFSDKKDAVKYAKQLHKTSPHLLIRVEKV